MKKYQKYLPWFTVAGLGIFCFLFAFGFESVSANGIMSSIKSDASQLKQDIDNAGGSFVKLIRYVSIIVAVAIFVWMMFSLKLKNDAQSLFDMKKRLAAFGFALCGVFFAEKILGTFLGIFNVQMPSFIMFFF